MKLNCTQFLVLSQNTFKNTSEDDLDTFCDIISYFTSKYRPDFLRTSKIAGPDEHYQFCLIKEQYL